MSNLSTATQCSEQNPSVVITPAGRDPDDRRPASRWRILLVEDDDLIRRVVLRFLHTPAYDVSVAENVEQARQLFNARGAHFDLLLSDVMLPDGNGYQLADELHRRDPALAILLSSGLPDERVCDAGADPGGLHFLPKPYGAAELAEALRLALAETRTD